MKLEEQLEKIWVPDSKLKISAICVKIGHLWQKLRKESLPGLSLLLCFLNLSQLSLPFKSSSDFVNGCLIYFLQEKLLLNCLDFLSP
jgi:hypothetical protein